MSTAASALRKGSAQVSLGARYLTALVFGGAIPIVAFVVAAALAGAGNDPRLAPVRLGCAGLAAGAVVWAGAIGLRMLDRGWPPFLRYGLAVAGVVLAAQLALG